MSDAVVKALQKKASLSAYQPTFREKASDVLRALLFSDDREGQRKAERLSNVLETVTPYGVATGIDDMREAVGQGDYATAGLMGAMAMVPGPSPKIKAYHGSPHSFDRFSMDKIGTGEGAQAYGHGLYFAENEGVARNYRDALSVPSIDGVPAKQIATTTTQADDDLLQSILAMEKTPENARWRLDRLNRLDLVEKLDEMVAAGRIKPSGSMYEVEINASPDDFLDWDKPLSEQGKKVLKAFGVNKPDDVKAAQHFGYTLDEFGALPPEKQADLISRTPKSKPLDYIGGDSHYMGLARDLGGKDKAADALKRAGIPGIKYLDAGSRPPQYGPDVQYLLREFGSKERALEVAKQRLASARSPREQIKAQEAVDALSIPETRNYVVFDENLINIVRKYGIAGASAMLGYNLMDSVDPAQAKQLEQLEQVRKLDSIMGGAKAK